MTRFQPTANSRIFNAIENGKVITLIHKGRAVDTDGHDIYWFQLSSMSRRSEQQFDSMEEALAAAKDEKAWQQHQRETDGKIYFNPESDPR